MYIYIYVYIYLYTFNALCGRGSWYTSHHTDESHHTRMMIHIYTSPEQHEGHMGWLPLVGSLK